MSRTYMLVVLGILVAAAPFSGLPISWLGILLPVIGIGIAVIGMSLIARLKAMSTLHHEASSSFDIQ